MNSCRRCGVPLDDEWTEWARANGVTRPDPACQECVLESLFTPEQKKIAHDSGHIGHARDLFLNVLRGRRV